MILPSKTKKGRDLITPEYHTEHQLFILKADNPVTQFRGRSGDHDGTSNKGRSLDNRKQHINKNLVNEEEIIGKSLGSDQGGRDNEMVMIRDLVEAYSASLAMHKGTSTYLTAQNSQSIFLEGQM